MSNVLIGHACTFIPYLPGLNQVSISRDYRCQVWKNQVAGYVHSMTKSPVAFVVS